MTLWVINESSDTVPLIITPSGRTIAESNVRRTRWTDPSDVEGFETYEPVTSNTSFASSIPAESVCCFEIVLDSEDFSNDRIEAESYSHFWGTETQATGIVDGDLNVGNISDGDFTRYGEVALTEDSIVSFRVARPSGRPDGIIEIREGNAEGPLLGQVAVPETGNWQTYETITTTLDVDAGIYNLYLTFVEDTTSTNNALFNLNWFTVNEPALAPVGLAANAAGTTQIDLSWNAAGGATSYSVKRSTTSGGPYTTISSGVVATSYNDTGLTSGTPYYYVVTAQYGSTESTNSDEASATPPVPSSPSGLAAAPVSATRIDLAWSAASGATSYHVKRSTTDGSGYVTVGNSTTPAFSNTGLAAGTRYYYVVTAIYGATESANSDQASAVPSNPILPENAAIGTVGTASDGSGGSHFSATIPQSGVGQFYQMIGTDDLTAPVWPEESPVYQGNGGPLELQLPIPPGATRHFYKVKVWRE